MNPGPWPMPIDGKAHRRSESGGDAGARPGAAVVGTVIRYLLAIQHWLHLCPTALHPISYTSQSSYSAPKAKGGRCAGCRFVLDERFVR
jgi:hypothetical protein